MFTYIIYAGGHCIETQTFQIEMFMKWYCSNAKYVDLARISVKSNRLDCVLKYSVIMYVNINTV